MEYRKIYKVLETILAIEILLWLFGAFTVAYFSPPSEKFFYWTVVPWSIVITAPFWLIARYKVKSAESPSR